MHIGNIILISPAIWLTVTAIIVLLAGVVASKRPDKGLDHFFATQHVAPLAMVGALVLQGMVIAYSLGLVGKTMQATINGVLTDFPAVGLFVTAGGHAQLTVDPFAAILSFVAIAGTLIVMLLSLEHFGEHQIHKAEYYSLLMFATVAASLAAASSDLIAIYLCIEFLSLTSYILAAFAKTDRRSAEAGLKYFLYGAACSAVMLYGMSILFGITGGNTSLSAIAAGFAPGKVAFSGVGWVAIMFTLAGLGFKLALVPFQFWAPDTYEGAPTPVTAFLSVVSKAAGLAVIIRFLTVVATPSDAGSLSWYWILVVLTALSMLYGNLVAIWQRNIKRMLAYSSIAQVGYMMVGVLAAMHTFTRGGSALGVPNASVRASVGGGSVPLDIQGVLIYVLAYLFMNLGAFAVVVAVGKRLKTDAIESYAGLRKHAPFYASALAVFLFSLAGVPPTAGFLGKFFVFGSAIKVGSPELVTLAVLGVVNSVISAYYYMNVVRLMFFAESKQETKFGGSTAVSAAIIVTLILTLALVVFAKPISDIAAQAVYAYNPVHIILPGP
ncbi:MAG: NADH-quinone oxidoreductase subunit N [Armatimonadota bacterium]